MPRKRGDDQNSRLRRIHVLGEMQQLAEGQFERDLFRHSDVPVADGDRLDGKIWPGMRQFETGDHFHGRRHLGGQLGGSSPHRRACHGLHAPRHQTHRGNQVVLKLVSLVEDCSAPGG